MMHRRIRQFAIRGDWIPASKPELRASVAKLDAAGTVKSAKDSNPQFRKVEE